MCRHVEILGGRERQKGERERTDGNKGAGQILETGRPQRTKAHMWICTTSISRFTDREKRES